jgi:hypothetical protein
MTNGKVVMAGPRAKIFGQARVQDKSRFGQCESREATQELNEENNCKKGKEC